MEDFNLRKIRFQMPVAVHLLLVKDNKVLLLRRFNTGYEDGTIALWLGM